MISIHFDAAPVVDFQTAAKGDNETFKKFFHGLLTKGLYCSQLMKRGLLPMINLRRP
jgi:glutamate-1-semialdehyde aminotransferase